MTRADIFEALYELAVATGGVREPVEVAELASEHARRLTGAEGVSFRVWDPDEEVLRRLYASDRNHNELGTVGRSALNGSMQAFLTRKPVVIGDYRSWSGAMRESIDNGLLALIAVPLLVRDEAIGSLSVRFYHRYDCTDDDVRTLSLLAAQVAPVIQAARDMAERQKSATRREALLRIVRRFATETDPEHLLDELLANGQSIALGDACSVRRWDELTQRLVGVRHTAQERFPLPPLALGQGAAGRAALTRGVVIINDYAERYPDTAQAKDGARAVIAIPLLYEGRLLGTISVVSRRDRHRFSREDAEALELLATVAGAILESLERTERLQVEAQTDQLTGVLNRRGANDLINHLLRLAARQEQPFSLALLDLDQFKKVNDEHGHAVGDDVLRRLGELLLGSFRGEDVAGRVGGEEFVVGLYGMSKAQAVSRLASLLETFCAETFVGMDGAAFKVTFSGGIAEAPTDGKAFQELYRAADQALYASKEAGRARITPAQDGVPAWINGTDPRDGKTF